MNSRRNTFSGTPDRLVRRVRRALAGRASTNAVPLLGPLLRILKLFDTVNARVGGLLLLAVAPFAVGLSLLAWEGYQEMEDVVRARADEVARQASALVSYELDVATQTLRILAASADDRALGALRLSPWAALSPPRVAAVVERGADGAIRTRIDNPTFRCSAGFSHGSDFIVPMGMERTLSLRYPPPQALDEAPCVEITMRRIDHDAGVQPRYLSALVSLEVSAASIRYRLKNRNEWPRIWVLAPDRRLLTLEPTHSAAGEAPVDAAALEDELLARNGRGDNGSVALNQRHRASVLTTLPVGLRLLVVATRSRDEGHARNSFITTVFLTVAVLILLLTAVGTLADAVLVRPINQLMDALSEWRQGGAFDTRIARSMPMELRALGFSFKRATRRLARHEARLSRALEHQRLLIHEIHHRVKNNLQIVASLLNLQANRIRQPEAQNEFRQARDRVRTLATLHRHLYPETGSTAMRMPLFLKELCSQIAAAHGEDGSDRISVVVEAEDFEMSVDQAVPLALVTTEIVSNAIRYAFPDDRPGTVRLTLRQERAGEAVMVIEDDGIGLAVGERSHDRSQRTGLGLQLIRGFVRQLGGVMRCTSDPEADASVPPLAGTRYVITFPLTPPRGELRGHVVS